MAVTFDCAKDHDSLIRYTLAVTRWKRAVFHFSRTLYYCLGGKFSLHPVVEWRLHPALSHPVFLPADCANATTGRAAVHLFTCNGVYPWHSLTYVNKCHATAVHIDEP